MIRRFRTLWVALLGLLVVGLAIVAYFGLLGSGRAKQLVEAPPMADIDVVQLADQIAKGPHLSVVSSDKRLELLIPKDALPAGRTAAEVRVTPLEVPAPDLAYQLEPDGLRLASPGVVRITSDLTDDGRTPMLLLISSGGEISELAPTLAQIDREKRQVVASAPIEHFSVVYDEAGVFSVQMTDPLPEYDVGKKFTIKGSIKQLKSSYTVEAFIKGPGGVLKPAPGRNQNVRIKEIRSLEGWWRVHTAPSPIQPDDADAPAKTSWDGSVFALGQEFTCVEWGRAAIKYYATIATESRFESSDVQTMASWPAWHRIEWSAGVDCTRPPTPTTTRTQTPTSTPTPTDTPEPTETPAPSSTWVAVTMPNPTSTWVAVTMPDPTPTWTRVPVPPTPTNTQQPAVGTAGIGMELFRTKGCSGCHSPAGPGGPAGINLAERTAAQIADAVKNGRTAGSKRMPVIDLTDSEVLDIYAYIQQSERNR